MKYLFGKYFVWVLINNEIYLFFCEYICYLVFFKILLCVIYCNVLRDLFYINLNLRIGMNINCEKYYCVFLGKYLFNRSYD